VELPTLISWIRDERVTAETWIYVEKNDTWQKAAHVSELQMFFRAKKATGPPASGATSSTRDPLSGIKPGSLRRVKIMADFTDDQLEHFVQFMEVQQVRQWTEVVKQGDHGDAMFLVLEGELRVRLMIGGKETTLVTLNPGEFFGEIALFDHGPRSADVVANKDSTLLKISAATFEKLMTAAPDLATPFLFAISKTLTARIRADNKRYRDSIQFARTAAGASP
jgi:CRP-like cAMP-binding protein